MPVTKDQEDAVGIFGEARRKLAGEGRLVWAGEGSMSYKDIGVEWAWEFVYHAEMHVRGWHVCVPNPSWLGAFYPVGVCHNTLSEPELSDFLGEAVTQ